MSADNRNSIIAQLARLRRRGKLTMQKLHDAMERLPAPDELIHLSDSRNDAQQCEFYADCIRLEVALDEAMSSAEKVALKAREFARSHAERKVDYVSVRRAGLTGKVSVNVDNNGYSVASDI